jgi:hypothetical protein
MNSNILQEIYLYEEELLFFVEQHYKFLKENWKKWLDSNSISIKMLETVKPENTICVSKAKSYKIIVENNRISFLEINQTIEKENKDSINREVINTNKNIIDIKNQAIHNFNLKLSGIHHYLEFDPTKSINLLHFDYLINKVELENESSLISASLPEKIPQQTFLEARRVAEALADGPRLIGWESITGKIGLRHIKTDQPLQARILLSSLQEEWQLPKSPEELRKELISLEQASLLLLNVVVGAALQHSQVTASIDELISRIGLQPRSRQERSTMRSKVWRWLLLFDSINIYGKPAEESKDKNTPETSVDALIKIVDKQFVKASINNQEKLIPLEITWVAGSWVDQWRNNSEILSYFGDLSKVAAVPTGKASGAWAQSIGLALHQLWRERTNANLSEIMVKTQLTVTPKIFTRFQLLSLFRCEPWVVDLLESNNPNRAKKYWQEAIRKLKYESGIIGHYQELNPIANSRKGWTEFWLKEQKLDIRPK